MPSRTKTRWTPDSRGRYSRRIGWKENQKGQRIQHLFYLGTDLKEAKRRENWLVELWEQVEKNHKASNGDKAITAEWNSLTLKIGKELAKGNRFLVIERNGNSAEAFARYLHRLQAAYPMVHFVPDEPETYQAGSKKARSIYEEKASEIERRHRKVGNISPNEISTTTDMLHGVIDACIEDVRTNYVLPGSDDVTPYGHTRIANMNRLKERHSDVPLSKHSDIRHRAVHD